MACTACREASRNSTSYFAVRTDSIFTGKACHSRRTSPLLTNSSCRIRMPALQTLLGFGTVANGLPGPSPTGRCPCNSEYTAPGAHRDLLSQHGLSTSESRRAEYGSERPVRSFTCANAKPNSLETPDLHFLISSHSYTILLGVHPAGISGGSHSTSSPSTTSDNRHGFLYIWAKSSSSSSQDTDRQVP